MLAHPARPAYTHAPPSEEMQKGLPGGVLFPKKDSRQRSEAMDLDLFARVRERLLDGTLWPLTDGQVLGGPGTNEPCAVCDQAITGGETEYEVAGPVMIAHVHVACYHAWNGESQRSA